MKTKTFKVNGMACDHCRTKVEKRLSCLVGVEKAEANLSDKSVTVTYDDELTKPEYMKKAIDEIGYDLQL